MPSDRAMIAACEDTPPCSVTMPAESGGTPEDRHAAPMLALAAAARDAVRDGLVVDPLATFADEWRRSTSAKSHALSDSQVALSGTFANADKIPLRPIPWLFIVPGLVLAVLAGATLVPERRRAVIEARRPGVLSPS